MRRFSGWTTLVSVAIIIALSWIYLQWKVLRITPLDLVTEYLPPAEESKVEPAYGPQRQPNLPKRLVVLGDLHGDLMNTLLLLEASGLVDGAGSWVAEPGTVLIQIGDVADRGPDAYVIYLLFERLGEEAKASNSTIVHLFGNHEVMNMCGMFHDVNPHEFHKHFNSSLPKMREAWGTTGFPGAFIRSKFNVSYATNNIFFVHAGLVPRFATVGDQALKARLLEQVESGCKFVSYSSGQAVKLAEEETEDVSKLDVMGDIGPTWSRLISTKPEKLACRLLATSLSLVGASHMVVGHTPTLSGGIETRCGNRLVMVDTAISRYMANSPTALEIVGRAWREISVSAQPREDGKSTMFTSVHGRNYYVSKRFLFKTAV